MSKNVRQQIALYLEDPRTVDAFVAELRRLSTTWPSEADIVEALRHSPRGIPLLALQKRVEGVTQKRLARRHAAAARQRPHLTHKLRHTFWP